MERFINNNLEVSLKHYSNGRLPGKLFRQKNFQKVFQCKKKVKQREPLYH